MEILTVVIPIVAIAIVVFSLILGAVYASHQLRFLIQRRQAIAKHDQRKLEAQQDFDYNIFYAELNNPMKQLSPIPGEVVNPGSITRCFDKDEEENL